MTSTDSLLNALQGINVTRARIDTITRNITNASTDGYSRKIQDQQANSLGIVQLGPVQRQVDQSLINSIRDSAARTGKLAVTVPMMSNIETVLGDPTKNSSLSGALTRLQSALQNLSASPEKSALYTGVLDAADGVARSFNQIYEAVESERTDVTNQLSNGLIEVNSTLKQIADVNRQIALQGGGGSDTTDLQDERDRLLDKLSSWTDFNTYNRGNGSIAIYTKQGQPLVDGDATSLSLTTTATTPVQTKVQIIPVSGPPLTMNVSTGKLGGLLTMTNVTVPGIEAQLDDMARAVTLEFYTPPVLPATTPTGLGIPLFNDGGSVTYDPATTPTQTTGFARRIAVSDTIKATPTLIRDATTAPPGLDSADTTNIDKAIALFNRTNISFTASTGLPASGSLLQVSTDFVAGIGTSRQTTQNQLDYENSLKQTLDGKRSSTSGVQIDDEVAQLTVLQQAYAANAKVIQTAKEMMDTLFAIFQ